MTKEPELFTHLFSIQAVEALCVMVEAHPLNDEMIASAVRLIGMCVACHRVLSPLHTELSGGSSHRVLSALRTTPNWAD